MSTSWGGLDPLLRALRAVAILAMLGLLIAVVLSVVFDGTRSVDPTLAAMLIGAILLALGYPFALRLPGVVVQRKEDEEKDD